MPVHGIDDGNNKHAVYTAEEVLAILQQAIISGSLQGIDPEKNPIVAAIRESHNNSNLTFWSGTEAEFNEMTGVTSELIGARIGSDGRLYLLTGDTTLSDTVEAARQAALEATEGMKREVISVTLTAAGWSNTAPYTQTVAVAGMTADKDFLAPYVVPTGNESDDLAAQVALSCISGGTTDTDSVTFYCYDEKPTTTITVFMVDKGTKMESGDFPIASKTAPGIMKVGDGLDVDENGEVSLDPQNIVDEVARGGVSEIESDSKKGYFDRSKYLNLKRIMREIRVNSRNPAYSSNDYSGMQGGIYIGNGLFIQASPRGENVQLKEINLSTGAEVRSTVLALQHANSLAYNPSSNEVYVTSLTLNSVYTHYVYVLDYATLTIKRTLELDLETNEGTHSVSYDNTTGKTYVGIETKSVNTFDLYELDVATGDMTAVELINYKNMLGSGGATNDMCIANGKMYLLKHSPAVLVVYDLETGKCENIFNVPAWTDFGVGTGEIESVSYDYYTGDLIIAGYKSDCKNGWVNLYNYFRTNLAQGIDSIGACSLSTSSLKTVYVDAASTDINPTGTSWAKAFRTVGEALECLNDERVKSLEIYVKAGTHPYFYVNTPKSVAVRGADASNRANQIIQGIEVERCNNFFMSAVTINRPNGDYDADITLSNAFITATAFSGSHDEHIHVYFSKVEFLQLTYSTILFRLQAENMLISNDGTPNYKIAGSMPAVNKPVQIAAFSNMSKTAVSASYAGREPLVETSSARLGFIVNGYYGHARAVLPTQTTDGGNRNFCVMLDSKILTIQIVFNKTDKTLSARITKAINLKSGELTDITDTATLNSGTLYFEY